MVALQLAPILHAIKHLASVVERLETKLDELQVQVQSCEDELRQELTFEVEDSDSDSDLSVQSAPPFLVPH